MNSPMICVVLLLSNLTNHSLANRRVHHESLLKTHPIESFLSNQTTLTREIHSRMVYDMRAHPQDTFIQQFSRLLRRNFKTNSKSSLLIIAVSDNLESQSIVHSGKKLDSDNREVILSNNDLTGGLPQNEIEGARLTARLNKKLSICLYTCKKRVRQFNDFVLSVYRNPHVYFLYLKRKYQRITSWTTIEFESGILMHKFKKCIGVYSKKDKEMDIMAAEYRKIMKSIDNLERDILKWDLINVDIDRSINESNRKWP